jgi:Fe-S cluster assembly iron-binding protein IscA
MEKTISAEDLNIFVTDSAVRQIQVMQENDYTLKGLSFRIKIGGKGCEGFTYETGFSSVHEGDLHVTKNYPLINFDLHLLIDPFTAYYTQDFVQLMWIFSLSNAVMYFVFCIWIFAILKFSLSKTIVLSIISSTMALALAYAIKTFLF